MSISRTALISARAFSQSARARAPAVAVPSEVGTVGVVPVRRPVGGFRGGLLGFFFGFSIASGYASYYLLQEYKLATSLLQGSVEELQESTAKMTNHLQRIENVEKNLKSLTSSSSSREDVKALRGEMKKLYDGLHSEVLDLRAHVWGVEQDLHKSAKAGVFSSSPYPRDEDDDTASSHLLQELQGGRVDGGSKYVPGEGVPGIDESRYTDFQDGQEGRDDGSGDDEPPQSLLFEHTAPQATQPGKEDDLDSSSTPRGFGPNSANSLSNQQSQPTRGRSILPSASASSMRSSTNSASPPPDLLNSRSPSTSPSTGLPMPVTTPGPSRLPHNKPLKSSLRAQSSSSRSSTSRKPRIAKPRGPEMSIYEKMKASSSWKGQHRINGDSLSDSSEPEPDIRPTSGKGKGKGKGKAREADEEEVEERRASREAKRERVKKELSEREKALWDWVNVIDLDGYLQEVYEYYIGKGLYAIALRRVLALLTSAFVILFSTFLLSCIDYSAFPADGHGILSSVIIDRCVSRFSVPHVALSVVLGGWFAWRLWGFWSGWGRLWGMKRFYEELLGVPIADIQTISWPEIVRRIGQIRNQNPMTRLETEDGEGGGGDTRVAKLDAHDVANRIMRQENYLIALFNKDLLDLRPRLPLPHPLVPLLPGRLLLPSTYPGSDRKFLSFGQNGLTKALEWNLRWCLLGYLFDQRGLVRKEFVRERKRKDLVERLQRRFIFMAILNAVFAPFIVLYLLMYSFFRYFEEYHKNPSAIGSRQYTPYGRWKFREFNELPHLFDKRLDESYPVAKQYIDQFPKEINALIMRFVGFIAGAFAAVLLLLSVIDPVFLHFEITQNRTVLFYLGVFTSIVAVSRGMMPQENKVFEPELLMKEVVHYTHYLPGEWKGNLHSKKVHEQFGQIFDMKITVFFQEIISVILTPLILGFSLPACSADIIDFFREFTVHVEGVGYVCSFAVFDFKRHGNVKFGAPAENNASERMQSKEGKMEKSFLHFTATHPEWQPSDPSASLFLSRVTDMHGTQSGGARPRKPVGPHARMFTDNFAPGNGSLAESDRLREKSQIYERALQRSIMLRSSTKPMPTRMGPRPVVAPIANGKLETMKERVEVDEADWETAEAARPGGGVGDSDEDFGRRRDGIQDAGIMGMLHQAMKR